MKHKPEKQKGPSSSPNFYIENGCYVFTESFLAQRGQCCGNGCRHCPFSPKHAQGSRNLRAECVQKL